MAWTTRSKATKAWFLGGDRKPIYSAGVALRLNLLGFAVLEVDAAHPFNRPGTGIVWQFGFKTQTDSMLLLADGRLQVTSTHHYTDGRPDRQATQFFIHEGK